MKIYIGKSGMHGKGLFAMRNIKKGEIIFIIKGEKIKFLINNEKQAEIASMNWVGYDRDVWVEPKSISIYFNHSCDPNAGIKGRVTVVALREIKKDEEITFDYSLNESDIFWEMKCNCGSKQCRKTIRSIQFLPESIIKQKIGCIPKYFQRVYKRFQASKFKNFEELRRVWVPFISKDF